MFRLESPFLGDGGVKERGRRGCGGISCGLSTSDPPGSSKQSPFSAIINCGGRGRNECFFFLSEVILFA